MNKAKSIIGSIFVIGVMLMLMGTATQSYFSDKETSTGNTFTAGTIDLAVSEDGTTWENPWVRESYEITGSDGKPCETFYDILWIKNVGNNDLDVWKHLTVPVYSGGAHPESEKDEDPNNDINDIASVMWYDLTVDDVVWIEEADKYTIVEAAHHLTGQAYSWIACYWIYLGTLTPGQVMKIEQSYHLDKDTTNWAQGDIMTFDIEFYALQTVGGATLPSGMTEHPDFHK
jgi:predicted ribosomally synthesized peptide with SipW-like signal peptide